MVDARIKITKQDRADFKEKGIGITCNRGRNQVITFRSSSITKLLKGREDRFPLVQAFHKQYGISAIHDRLWVKEFLFSSKLVILVDDGVVKFHPLELSKERLRWIGYGIHFAYPGLYFSCRDPIIKIKTGLLCDEMNLLYDGFNKVILDTLVEKGKISFLEDNKLTLGTKCTTTAQNWKK